MVNRLLWKTSEPPAVPLLSPLGAPFATTPPGARRRRQQPQPPRGVRREATVHARGIRAPPRDGKYAYLLLYYDLERIYDTMKKKILSLLIVFAMMLSMVPMAFATTVETGNGLLPDVKIGAPESATVYSKGGETEGDDSWIGRGSKTIKNSEEFANWLLYNRDNSNQGDGYMLDCDVDLGGATITIPANARTLNANGHTIKNVTFACGDFYWGFYGGTLQNCTFTGRGGAAVSEGIYDVLYVTESGTIKNCVFRTSAKDVIGTQRGTILTLQNCLFDSQTTKEQGMLAGTNVSGVRSITNCVIRAVAASIFRVNPTIIDSGSVTVDKCLVIGSTLAAVSRVGGGDLTGQSVSALLATVDSSANKTSVAYYGSDAEPVSYNGANVINNNGMINMASATPVETGYGLLPDVEIGAPESATVYSKGGETEGDDSWIGRGSKTIKNSEEFANWLLYNRDNSNQGDGYMLDCDVDLGGATITIPANARTLNANGHTIKNVTFACGDFYWGFYGGTLQNCTFTGRGGAAVSEGIYDVLYVTESGTIKNCVFRTSAKDVIGTQRGTILTLQNCLFDSQTTKEQGMLAGTNVSGVRSITNCVIRAVAASIFRVNPTIIDSGSVTVDKCLVIGSTLAAVSRVGGGDLTGQSVSALLATVDSSANKTSVAYYGSDAEPVSYNGADVIDNYGVINDVSKPAEPPVEEGQFVPLEDAVEQLDGINFIWAPATASEDQTTALGETYDASKSTFFSITADGDVSGFNADKNSWLKVTMYFADAAHLSKYTLARFDEDTGEWTTNGLRNLTKVDNDTISFETNHASDFGLLGAPAAAESEWVPPTEGEYKYYAVVEPADGTTYTLSDDNGDGFTDLCDGLKLGDSFTVKVYASDILMGYKVNFQYDSKYLQLDNDPSTTGVTWDQDAQAGDKVRWTSNPSTGAPYITTDTALGEFTFTLVNNGGGAIAYPYDIEFSFYPTDDDGFPLMGVTPDRYLDDDTMEGIPTIVRLVDGIEPVCIEPVCEVIPFYGHATSLILVYSRDVGQFKITSDTLFGEGKTEATLQDVTGAGYIYYDSKDATDNARTATDGTVLMASKAFYDHFDESKGEAPSVYAIAVNFQRLKDATGVADETKVADMEAWVLKNIKDNDGFTPEADIDDADKLTPVEYNVKGIVTKETVDASTMPRTVDKAAVEAIANIGGDDGDSTETAWPILYERALAQFDGRTALRCDFVRDADDITTFKNVGAREFDTYTNF